MSSKITFWIVSLSFIFWACSNDDNGIADDQETTVNISDFKLIGEDLENIYQYNYNSETETGDIANLTISNGVDRNYVTLSQADEFISFFSFNDGSFSLVRKDLNSSSSQAVEDFISVSDERSIIWGSTSESQIFMSYYAPPGTGQLGVRTIDLDSGDFADTELATEVFDTLDPLYFNGRLFAAYIDFSDRYHMVVFDTENLVVLRAFDFGDSFPSILINEEGNPVIFRGDGGSDFTLELYDLETMDLLGSTEFTLNKFLSTGAFDAYLVDNRLYYLDFLIQPSPVPFAPAVFDFGSGSSSTVDIFSILQQAQETLGNDILLTAYGFDVSNSIFLLGFASVSELDEFNGGVLVIDENGTLIDVMELPFVPTYFIKP